MGERTVAAKSKEAAGAAPARGGSAGGGSASGAAAEAGAKTKGAKRTMEEKTAMGAKRAMRAKRAGWARILSAALAAALAAMLLAGCGGGGETGQTAATQAPATTAASAASTEGEAATAAADASEAPATEAPTTAGAAAATEPAAPAGEDSAQYPIVPEPITLKGMVVNKVMDSTRMVWDDAAKLTNVNFEFTSIPEDQVAAYMAAGDWPDLFVDALQATYLNDYGVMGGRFADYNELLQYMPNLRQTFADYPDALKAVTETNGAIYQLPCVQKAVTDVNVRVYYRKDNLANIGEEFPNTTEEFASLLKKLKDSSGTYPLELTERSFGTSGYPYFERWAFEAFGEMDVMDYEDAGDGATVVWNRWSDQYRRMLAYVSRLYSEGLLDPEFLTMDAELIVALAKEGKATFFEGAGQQLTAEDFPSGKVEVGVAAPLTSEFNPSKHALGANYVLGANLAINSASQHKVEIAKLLDTAYATSEVAPGSNFYSANWCYGPQGITWDWTNAERTEYSQIVPPEYGDITFSELQQKVLVFGNAGRADTWENAITSTPGNGQERQIGFRDNMLPYMGKSPFPTNYLKFTTEEQAVVDNLKPEIDAYVNEMRGKFITGLAGIDAEWDAYVSQLHAMGGDDVLAQYQAAYDRWNGK
ncbi:MAG: hypothetical protein LBJ10_03285 [Clostridiales bacterium]|nr:hypothetical protein [Clostridiales bacterium]